ncbi:MAG: tRNA1(Val) (adenine(37)-N6)-methyltransferase [Lachnospiraceae bacterium]|jgi:tRNA1Val (adenine37-N6)-methyltransferase|nr:tRNA1(Val) (adenine(37)-N6)-methyltransferase [Lachnospiraceae bacterium]
MVNPNWTTIELKEGERVDDLERCGFKIIQNTEKFCFGMDAVLLSGYASIRRQDKVLDLCTGNGIIPILLAAKTGAERIVGIEIQRDIADLAKRSVEANDLSDRVNILCADIKDAEEYYQAGAFDAVTCNPPYMIDNHGIKNPDSPKAIARHEILCTFDDVARVASRMLKPGGRMFLIHRPFRLTEIFETLTKYSLEPKRMKLVYPYVNREPNMVLIEAGLGGRRRLTVERPLIVYESPNCYTKEIYDIYGY